MRKSLKQRGTSLTATSIASAAQRHFRTVREVRDNGKTLVVFANWRVQLNRANELALDEQQNRREKDA